MILPRYILLLAFIGAVASATAQDSTTVRPAAAPHQHYLALDADPTFGGFNRYRYQPGQTFTFRDIKGDKYRAPIYGVTDSLFSLSLNNEVMGRYEAVPFRLTDVQTVFVKRQIPFVTQGSVMLPLAGLVYFLVDFVNTGVKDGRGWFAANPRSLIPSGALVAAGAVCYKISFPRYKVGKKHRLRVF
jgi:hypothetical protein